MKWDVLTAFAMIMLILTIGEFISTKTKAIVPSVFMSAVIFLFGFWTFLPKDLMEMSGLFMPLSMLSMYLIITHMGTMFSIDELKQEWKSAAISLSGVVGIVVGILGLGWFVFEKSVLFVSVPPLTGGLVAAIIMKDVAAAKGLPDLSLLAILLYVMQGFVGYPLTAYALKKEAKRLQKEFRENGNVAKSKTESSEKVSEKSSNGQVKVQEDKSFFIVIPKKYQNAYFYFFQTALLACLAVYTEKLIGGVISKFVICLIFGAVGAEIGFIQKRVLDKTASFGMVLASIMVLIFQSLSTATPEALGKIFIPMVGVIIFGAIGLVVMASLIGKKLGYTKEMSMAIGLNAFYGFPANYVLTNEAARAVAESDEELEYITHHTLPKMLVGGFVSVTIVSVIVAGIFSKLI